MPHANVQSPLQQVCQGRAPSAATLLQLAPRARQAPPDAISTA